MMFKTLDELTGMKMPMLNSIIKAYKDLGIALPDGGFDNNANRIEFIRQTAADVGAPHQVTAEDLEREPELATDGKVKEGDIVLRPIEGVTGVSTGSANATIEQSDGLAEAYVAPVDPVLPKESESTAGAAQGLQKQEGSALASEERKSTKTEATEESTAPSEEQISAALQERKIIFEGQVITSIRNRVANGRLLKELDCGASCFTVTVEELHELVRKAQ